jgi:hypothetical protein
MLIVSAAAGKRLFRIVTDMTPPCSVKADGRWGEKLSLEVVAICDHAGILRRSKLEHEICGKAVGVVLYLPGFNQKKSSEAESVKG